jgi:hypothetical protein
MIKLIKSAAKQQQQVIFNVGDTVQYVKTIHDGRSYENVIIEGTVIKVHRVNLDFITEKGNVFRATKTKLIKL